MRFPVSVSPFISRPRKKGVTRSIARSCAATLTPVCPAGLSWWKLRRPTRSGSLRGRLSARLRGIIRWSSHHEFSEPDHRPSSARRKSDPVPFLVLKFLKYGFAGEKVSLDHGGRCGAAVPDDGTAVSRR